MEKLNTPIYRAKKIDKDEYVIGYYFYYHYYKRHSIKKEIEDVNGTSNYDIDYTTLSIHSPDMLDYNNKPIFASLREDGKGGDEATILERNKANSEIKKIKFTFKFTGLFGLNYPFMLTGKDYHYKKEDLKIIGIHE